MFIFAQILSYKSHKTIGVSWADCRLCLELSVERSKRHVDEGMVKCKHLQKTLTSESLTTEAYELPVGLHLVCECLEDSAWQDGSH